MKPVSGVVLSYDATSNHRVAHGALPADAAKGLPRLDVRVVLLGRLEVDRAAHGLGLGSLLLIAAWPRAQHLAERVGIRTVEVDAIDDASVRFRLRFGLMPRVDALDHLFLSRGPFASWDCPSPGADAPEEVVDCCQVESARQASNHRTATIEIGR